MQHPHGLAYDLDALARQMQRRRALRWLTGLGAAGALPLWGCGGGGGGGGDAAASTTTTTTTTTTGTSTSTSSSCSTIPTETAGPYPADGSLASGQRLNALALSGIVRSDIRSSIAGASGTAPGVPLSLTVTLVSASNACASLAGYAIYVWHCTRDGGYSLYSSGFTAENYLRGVQVTDANGQVNFTTIFPGCYAGRWPHIHFEIYPSLAAATDAGVISDYAKVSQLALPEDVCRTVYATSGYGASTANLNAIPLANDMIFSDGYGLQMAAVSGSVAAGYSASLRVGIAV